MVRKPLIAILLALAVIYPVRAESDDKSPIVSKPTPNQPVVSANEVPGISLPANFSVPWDEGYVTVKATADGPVEWIVISTTTAVKYKIHPAEKEIDVAIRPNDKEDYVITLFCYGLTKDKELTRAARCDILVEKQVPRPPPDDNTNPVTPAPKPAPRPAPNPVTPVAGGYIITIVEDPRLRTADYTVLTHWLSTAAKLQAAGHIPYLRDVHDASIQNPQSGFPNQLRNVGSLPALIVQDRAGHLLKAIACPKTESELFGILSNLGGH